ASSCSRIVVLSVSNAASRELRISPYEPPVTSVSADIASTALLAAAATVLSAATVATVPVPAVTTEATAPATAPTTDKSTLVFAAAASPARWLHALCALAQIAATSSRAAGHISR